MTRAKHSVESKLEKWLEDWLDGDRWAQFSYREIARLTHVSHNSVKLHIPRIVAEMTGRDEGYVRAMRRRRSEEGYSPPFARYMSQQLHRRGKSIRKIAGLIGLSPRTVARHIKAPHIELPPDTAGSKISHELRRVLKDELDIVIRPDGTTRRIENTVPGDLEKPPVHEHRRGDLETKPSEHDTGPLRIPDRRPPAHEETSKQVSSPVRRSSPPCVPTVPATSTYRPHYPVDREFGDRPREDIESLGETAIFIVVELHHKKMSVEEILTIFREWEFDITEAQVRKCGTLELRPRPYVIDLRYAPLMRRHGLL